MPVNSRKKILFISHESSLTGAPVLLLNLLKLIKVNGLYDFEIVLYRGGALENEFKELAPTTVLKSHNYATTTFIVQRFFNFINYRLKLKKLSNKVKDFDLVFSNTITNGKVLKAISLHNIPVISYVHELSSVIEQYQKDAKLTLELSNIIAIPSYVVGRNLKSMFPVLEKEFKRLDYFFPITETFKGINKQVAQKEFLDKFQLPKDKFYVVSMGTATHRKGIDLFLEICKELKLDKEFFFVWIGDFVESNTKEGVIKDVKELTAAGNLYVTGFLPHSLSNLSPFDLFCLPSREDPYPLVVIEAALLKIPSLCFDSGGASEFVNGECGWLIDGFSAKAMAEKIKELKNNKKQIETVGNNAFKKAVSLHSDEKRIFLQFDSIIKDLLV